MAVFFKFKDVKVQFGKYDTDVIFEYTLCLDFRPDGEYTRHKKGHEKENPNPTTVFYDELHMVSTAMMTWTKDIMYLNIMNHKLDVSNKFAQTN